MDATVRAGERSKAISYRNHFNQQAENASVIEKDRELRRLDADFTTAALMGAHEVENGGIAGRLATGVATHVAQQRLTEKRKRENAEMIRLLTHLRDTLNAIDSRLDEITREIGELQIDLSKADQDSQDAFDRMHALELLLTDIDREGWSEDHRIQIRNALGADSHSVLDDKTLRSMTEERIEQEREIGTKAFERAEHIRKQIAEKKAIQTELERARDKILANPNLSAEEKTQKLQEALERSLEMNTDGVEIDHATTHNPDADESCDSELVAETVESDFDFDEDEDITLIVDPKVPGLR